MLYYLEYGGGLGDIFNQIYNRSDYRGLMDLGVSDRAIVALICHNPFAKELFAWHPKRQQLDVRPLPYWPPSENAVNRRRYRLGGAQLNAIHDRPVSFYPSDHDHQLLDKVRHLSRGRPLIVLAASAGLPERNIPATLLDRTVAQLLASDTVVVAVGRNYERHGRCELIPESGQVLNYVDQLSVPGTAELVRSANGLITTHSSMNILGWHLRIPQLLVYPPSVVERHFKNGRDEWSFGLDWDITFHSTFDDLDNNVVDAFLDAVRVDIALPRCANTALSSSKLQGLFRAVQSTKNVEGAIAVLGVYKGGSTRLVAFANPEKTVHAFDTFTGIPNAEAGADGHSNGDFSDTSLDAVKSLLNDLPNVRVYPGIFPRTAQILSNEKFSMAYFDADTRASLAAFLQFFPSRMNRAGAIVVDDYGWERCPSVKLLVDYFTRNSRWRAKITAEYQVTLRTVE
jgi:O-methyltransferase